MEKIRDIILKNKDFKFVVITHNKQEFEALRDVLLDMGFEHSLPFVPLAEGMNERATEVNYHGCWRISDYMGVCWSGEENFEKDLAHWQQYCPDILELNENGEFVFVK